MRTRLPAIDEIPPTCLADEIPVNQRRVIRIPWHRENMAISGTTQKQEHEMMLAHGAHTWTDRRL